MGMLCSASRDPRSASHRRWAARWAAPSALQVAALADCAAQPAPSVHATAHCGPALNSEVKSQALPCNIAMADSHA